MDEVKEKVLEVLGALEDGETITFGQLVRRVANPGDCLNCLEGPVRRALTKLIDGEGVGLRLAD